ncbi:unnamed protein product [Closterium sp. Yama58-4]|nr:unnamed protein product [Closterium sp. Yama58-4]
MCIPNLRKHVARHSQRYLPNSNPKATPKACFASIARTTERTWYATWYQCDPVCLSARSMQHAATILVGGKKGWPGMKSWTVPTIGETDTLVFKWGHSSVDKVFGTKHNLANAKTRVLMDKCDTKAVDKVFIKATGKAKKSFTLNGVAGYNFYSTVGKDCAKRGIALAVSFA